MGNISRKRGPLILDGGCGTGWVSFFLQKAGLKTVMLDASREMLAKCLLLKSSYGLSSPLIKGTLTDLPFEKETFDVCILLDVLEHIPALSRCMKEIWRVLTAGGKLLMTTPNKFGTYTGIYDFIGEKILKRQVSDHVHFFSIKNLLKTLYEYGFLVEKVENIEFFSPLFHMVSRNLKYGRRLICYLSKMDVSLSDLLPDQVVSEWFIIAFKSRKKISYAKI